MLSPFFFTLMRRNEQLSVEGFFFSIELLFFRYR